MEPLDERITKLELWMGEIQEEVTKNQTKMNIKRVYVGQNFNEIEQTLTGLTRHMTIVDEITKHWNRMEGELKTLNEEMVLVC